MIVRPKAKLAKAAVASFGAALTSLNVAPQLEAAIVEITVDQLDPTSVSYSESGGNVAVSVNSIFEVGTTYDAFSVTNSQYYKAIFSNSGLISSFVSLAVGQTVTVSLPGFTNSIDFGPSAAGTVYLGFLASEGEITGWLRLDLQSAGEAILFLGGAYNDEEGEPIFVGQVPEPSAAALAGLAALALGATGVRRLRKRRSEES